MLWILTIKADFMRRVMLVSGLAILGLLTRVHADVDRANFAAYCVGYYKSTIQEMRRSLNESREWARRYADRPQEDRQAWQKVIDTTQRELQGEMQALERMQKYLAGSRLLDSANNLPLAIHSAELRAEDDLWACFNDAAPGQEAPPSCERLRRCRNADNGPL
jgi:hypothetical protein